MAEKRATLIMQLKDQVSRKLSGISGAVKTLRQNWLGITAAVGGVIAVGATAVKAFIKQENAVEKLNQALKTQGVFTDKTSKEIQKYASSLQKITTVGDETIIEQQALLVSFGATGETLKSATKAALDLSAGLGIDLKASTLLLGKALAGDTATLSRYGIKIKEGTKESEKFNAVMEQVNAKFGGAAQSRLNTFSGKVENLTGRIGDLQEKIGEQLIPVLSTWVRWSEKIVGIIEKITDAEIQQAKGRELTILTMERERDLILEQLRLREEAAGRKLSLSEQDAERLIVLTDAINTEKELLTIENKKIDQSIKAGKLSTKLSKTELAEKKKQNIEFKKLNEKRLKEELDTLESQKQAEILLNQQRAENFASTLQFISSLSQSKNKELAIIGKIAAIALAKINTARAITLALASAPPPFNFVLAAAVGAAGAAQIATIAGVQLERGGLIPARPGGQLATIGEGGRDEAVIPLEDDRTTDALRESGFGGSQITINAGVFVGDPDEFVKMVDEKLFSLRRNNQSVAFEGL